VAVTNSDFYKESSFYHTAQAWLAHEIFATKLALSS